HFFLEIDRSTMPHTAFREKIRAYHAYREQGRHAKKLGIQTFRVLTVTLTQARAENLTALAARMLPESARKGFLFGAPDRFPLRDPRDLYECRYLTPRTPGAVQPLIPPRLRVES